MGDGYELPWATPEERDELAVAYLRRTGNDDVIRVLGLDDARVRVFHDKLTGKSEDRRRKMADDDDDDDDDDDEET